MVMSKIMDLSFINLDKTDVVFVLLWLKDIANNSNDNNNNNNNGNNNNI